MGKAFPPSPLSVWLEIAERDDRIRLKTQVRMQHVPQLRTNYDGRDNKQQRYGKLENNKPFAQRPFSAAWYCSDAFQGHRGLIVSQHFSRVEPCKKGGNHNYQQQK